jgi:hypothetical protein
MTPEQMQQRMSRMEDMLRELDTNHNGMLDAEEVSGPRKQFIEGMLSRAGIELKYPIPLSTIRDAMTKSYQARLSQPGGPPLGATAPKATGSADPPPPGAPAGFGPPAGLGVVAGFGPPGPGKPPGPGSPTAPPGAPPLTSPLPSGDGQGVKVPAAAPSPSGTAPPAAPPSTTPSTATLAPTAGAPVAAPSASAAPVTPAAPATASKPRSGRFLTPTERLPKGLPAWFLAKDVRGNGQLTMAEFATEWTPEAAAEFNRYDLNHDGIITAAEVLKVEGRHGERSPR